MDIKYFQHRSCLFVPAYNMRAMEKTLKLDVDTVIFDLEDSVSERDKNEALENLSLFLKSHKKLSYQVAVRVNRVIGNKHEELKFVSSLPIDALVIAKVENCDELDCIYSISKAVAQRPIPIWVMIETPRGILEASNIAAHPNVVCLIVGPNDIALATGVNLAISSNEDTPRAYFIPWLMHIVLAAKAGHCFVLDGVYNDYKDKAGFEKECCQAQAMGFDGKTLIHPHQIASANSVFMPTKAQIKWAQTIIDAFAMPINFGKGVIAVNGQMVEALHLIQAKRIVQRAGQ